MKSPLSIYNEFAKEFDVLPEKQLHIRQKMAHVESQIQEKKAIINRLLVDIAITKTQLDKMQDKPSQEAYEGKIAEYRKDVRQLSDSLSINMQLYEEFSEEFKKSGEET